MQYFLAALLIALLVYFAARWFVNQTPETIAGVMRNFSKWGLVALGLVLLLRGQVYIGLAMIAAGGVALLGPGARPGWLGQGGRAGRSGKVSQVRSRMLEMQLDHDTGAVDGLVLKGAFEGRRLSEMVLDDLLALDRECAAEGDQSSALLQAFLDRMHPDWHEGLDEKPERATGGNGAGPQPGGKLTREQAYEVLGLPSGADEAAIRRAHKTLMKQFHPDKGGSGYLAAMINQAKDVLLGT
jgi:DnaJ-domain-containing protein 1